MSEKKPKLTKEEKKAWKEASHKAAEEARHIQPEPYLNKEVEFVTRCNALVQQFNPKPGLLMIGDLGLEWRSDTTAGFVKIPYKNIKTLKVQIVFSRWVKAFIIITDEDKKLELIVSQGRKALQAVAEHIERSKIVDNNGLSVIGRFKKKK
jgi:hypothetical protein